MEEVNITELETRYYTDLFSCCDIEKTGKVPILKATEMFRSADIPNDVLRHVKYPTVSGGRLRSPCSPNGWPGMVSSSTIREHNDELDKASSRFRSGPVHRFRCRIRVKVNVL